MKFETGLEVIKLECLICKGECRSLHKEWRGVEMPKPCCPTCANEIALKAIKNGTVDAA